MNRDLYSNTQDYINRWVVSYADFVTLLLALFMVMYALSQLDINNLKEFSSSVGKAFEIPAKQGVPQKNINTSDQKEINKLQKIFNTTEVKIKVQNINTSNQRYQASNLKTNFKDIESTIDKDQIEYQNIEKLIRQKLNNTDEILIRKEARGLIIRLKDTVLFDPGSDIIKNNARITLDKLAGILKEIPNTIRIEGHTDNKPIKTAKFPSNWELSTARATSIIRYLVNTHKFNPRKMIAVGYGEYMPLDRGLSKYDQNSDRRVDIVVLSSASKIFEPDTNRMNEE